MIHGEDERNSRVDVQMSNLLVSGGGGVLLIATYWYNHQRVLNDLWRTRLSRRPLIWLFPCPFLVSKLDQATHRKTEQERQLADGRLGGCCRGAKSYDGEKAWFNKSFNTLWVQVYKVHTMHGAIRRSISKKSTKLCGK